MAPPLYFTPTRSVNDEASHILTARSTSSSSAPVDYNDPGEIAGLFFFGLFAFVFVCIVLGFAIACLAKCCPWLSNLKYLFVPLILPFKALGWAYDHSLGPWNRKRKQRKRDAWTARYNLEAELSNRASARRRWAQEELKLARKDGRRPNLPSNVPRDWIADMERRWKGGRLRFEDLPPELRLEVYSHFDYGTALKLMRVNKFFYFDRPANGIDREQRATYVYHAETLRHNRHRLACYGCLRVLEKHAFEKANRTGSFVRFGEEELDRRCFECQIVKGEIAWPRWRRIVRLVKASTTRTQTSRRRP